MNIMRTFFAKVIWCTLLAVCLMLAGCVSLSDAHASQGFHLYSWGIASGGRLGRPITAEHPNSHPARVVDQNDVAHAKWIASQTAAGGSWAISTNGELFAWGSAWANDQMGQDGVQPPAEFLSGSNIARPMRVGTASNWAQLSAVDTFVVLLNSDGEIYRLGAGLLSNDSFGGAEASNIPVRVQGGPSNFVHISGGSGQIYAVTADGELWVAGRNQNGQLADGTTITGSSSTLVKVENTDDNWVHVSGRAGFAVALNSNGELFSWGSNTNGQTGHDTTTGHTLTPTQIGTADNWVDARVLQSSGVALNSNGELFSWGLNTNGRTGHGTATGHTLTPTQIGTESNWRALSGGNIHVHAFNEDLELWGWGLNNSNQLGVTGGDRLTPEFILQTYGFENAARGGGAHSMMLIRTTPAEPTELPLTKHLQKPTGTPTPTITFTFNATAHSFNDLTAPAQVANVPTIPLANRTITIDPTSDYDLNTPQAGILTTRDYTNLLEGIEFAQAGRFAWRVTEVQTATGVGASSTVNFSQAEYEIAVYVAPSTPGSFEVATMTIHRLRDTVGDTVNPPYKVPNLTFANIYMRTTTGTTEHPGGLTVSKTAAGNFANLNTDFDFDVTLTRTALCPTNTTFTGRILNAAGTQIGSSIIFESGVQRHVELRHGQRLVFDELVVGTTFTVTERAALEFRASVELLVNGTPVSVAPNENPNTALPIGNHLVGVDRNSAAFTNTHAGALPTGISGGSNPALLLTVVAIGLGVVLIATKKRKAIEELS